MKYLVAVEGEEARERVVEGVRAPFEEEEGGGGGELNEERDLGWRS